MLKFGHAVFQRPRIHDAGKDFAESKSGDVGHLKAGYRVIRLIGRIFIPQTSKVGEIYD